MNFQDLYSIVARVPDVEIRPPLIWHPGGTVYHSELVLYGPAVTNVVQCADERKVLGVAELSTIGTRDAGLVRYVATERSVSGRNLVAAIVLYDVGDHHWVAIRIQDRVAVFIFQLQDGQDGLADGDVRSHGEVNRGRKGEVGGDCFVRYAARIVSGAGHLCCCWLGSRGRGDVVSS